MGSSNVYCGWNLQELQDSVAQVKGSREEMMKIHKEIVDFHGEMVLLENYSALNYTGTSNFHIYYNICLFFYIDVEM